MGRIYKRNCNACGDFYEGWGVKFCSHGCSREEPKKDSPDFLTPISIHITPKKYVAAKQIGLLISVHYGDIHFPQQYPLALTIRNKILDFLSPSIVVDHGDTLDCESISKYPKDPHNRISLADEIQMAARDLGEVHALTSRAKHIWFEGNHEERLKRILWKASDDRALGDILTLEGISKHLEWGNLLGISSLGWETFAYPKHKLLFDKLMLIHGNTVRTQSAYSARAEHDRYGKSGLSGHTHRMGSYYHRDYNGIHSWNELGMLGRIREDYVAHANWQQGMGVVTWSTDRSRWGFEPIVIHEGMAIFRGLKFTG